MCEDKAQHRYLGRVWLVLVVLLLTYAAPVWAEDESYSGDFLTRSTLTGDWGGWRDRLAKKGVVFDARVVQSEQGVVGGGKREKWEYGGRGDLTLTLDSGKMGLWPGGFLTAELEGNWGHSANEYTGSLMPVNTSLIFPVAGDNVLGLPALNLTQFLSHYVGVTVGKYDMMSIPLNDFAEGKGDKEFMNTALNFDPVLLMTVPYSTLGAGFVILPTQDPKGAMVYLMVISSEGEANTPGFSSLDGDKLTFMGLARVRTDFFGKTGHQALGVTYSNREFTNLDQRLANVLTHEIDRKKGSWAVFYNFDQYLFERGKGSGKGAGLFGRFGTSDGNPNPVQNFFSVGAGGKGVMANRPDDRFGIGWYYIDVNSPRFTILRRTREFLRDEQGFEAYYSAALTPWAMLTPDIQVVHPAQQRKIDGTPVHNATVLGLRLLLMF